MSGRGRGNFRGNVQRQGFGQQGFGQQGGFMNQQQQQGGFMNQQQQQGGFVNQQQQGRGFGGGMRGRGRGRGRGGYQQAGRGDMLMIGNGGMNQGQMGGMNQGQMSMQVFNQNQGGNFGFNQQQKNNLQKGNSPFGKQQGFQQQGFQNQQQQQQQQQQQKKICSFFQKGTCRKGNSCPYLHVNNNQNFVGQQGQQQQGMFNQQQGGFTQQQGGFNRQQGGFNQQQGGFNQQQGGFNQQQGGFNRQQGGVNQQQSNRSGSPFVQNQQGGFNTLQNGSPFQGFQGGLNQQGGSPFQNQGQSPFQQNTFFQSGFQQQQGDTPFATLQQQQQQQQQGHNVYAQQGQLGFQNQMQKPKICHQFRKGRCKFGANCKFSHDLSAGNFSDMNVDTDMDMMTDDYSVSQGGEQDIDMDSGVATDLFRVNSNGEMSDNEVSRSMKALTSAEPVKRAPSPDHLEDSLPIIKSLWEDETVLAEEAELEDQIEKMWAESGDLNRYDWSLFRNGVTSFEAGRIPTNAPPRRLDQEERTRIVEKEELAEIKNSPAPSRYCTATA